jgi:cation diffusion facilitator family transporter
LLQSQRTVSFAKRPGFRLLGRDTDQVERLFPAAIRGTRLQAHFLELGYQVLARRKVAATARASAFVLVIGKLAAVAILRESYFGLLDPQPMQAPGTGLAINALATIINAGWAFVLIRHGRRRRSPALVADGQHLVTDVLTSIGVFIGLVLANLTGIAVLDPLLAALVALNILWTGWRIMKASVGGLMDEAAPADVVDRVREVISDTGEGAIEAHDVRTRHAGHTTFVEFHLVVPGDMSVFTAHEICDRIEAALRQEVEGAVVTIHVEPENKAKHSGIVVI